MLRYKNFNPNKGALINYAFEGLDFEPMSFADLGGVWNVDGAYTFYTLDHFRIARAFLVDTTINDAVRELRQNYDQLMLLGDNFGSSKVPETLKHIDVIYLFDVLLHQVAPNWDEILRMYASVTSCFAIFNQQWVGGSNTIRLIDLGLEEYLKHTPYGEEDRQRIQSFFDKLDEHHPRFGRHWRDIQSFWQWGITDNDIQDVMSSLGFTLQYYVNCGQFFSVPGFENHAFLFQKRDNLGIKRETHRYFPKEFLPSK